MCHVRLYKIMKKLAMTKLNDLLKKLKGKELDKDLVFYSNNEELYSYEFLGVYENEGQIEIHIDEGEKL